MWSLSCECICSLLLNHFLVKGLQTVSSTCRDFCWCWVMSFSSLFVSVGGWCKNYQQMKGLSKSQDRIHFLLELQIQYLHICVQISLQSTGRHNLNWFWVCLAQAAQFRGQTKPALKAFWHSAIRLTECYDLVAFLLWADWCGVALCSSPLIHYRLSWFMFWHGRLWPRALSVCVSVVFFTWMSSSAIGIHLHKNNLHRRTHPKRHLHLKLGAVVGTRLRRRPSHFSFHIMVARTLKRSSKSNISNNNISVIVASTGWHLNS